jgi:hypothetical protein
LGLLGETDVLLRKKKTGLIKRCIGVAQTQKIWLLLMIFCCHNQQKCHPEFTLRSSVFYIYAYALLPAGVIRDEIDAIMRSNI